MCFDFIFTNWRHHKSNLILLTRAKNKVAEQPTKRIIPEINITQQQQQQQQQQQLQQNEQKKEEILETGKIPESYEKRVAHPLVQRPEKNNEMPPPPAFTTTAPSKSKSFMPTAKLVMDARVSKKEVKKHPGFKSN